MLKFVKINVNLVQKIMGHLNEQIDIVERIRAAGPDAKLRSVHCICSHFFFRIVIVHIFGCIFFSIHFRNSLKQLEDTIRSETL